MEFFCWQEFNYGVESVVLISFNKSSIGRPAQAALDALANLTLEFPSLIVQATKGVVSNLYNFLLAEEVVK